MERIRYFFKSQRRGEKETRRKTSLEPSSSSVTASPIPSHYSHSTEDRDMENDLLKELNMDSDEEESKKNGTASLEAKPSQGNQINEQMNQMEEERTKQVSAAIENEKEIIKYEMEMNEVDLNNGKKAINDLSEKFDSLEKTLDTISEGKQTLNAEIRHLKDEKDSNSGFILELKALIDTAEAKEAEYKMTVGGLEKELEVLKVKDTTLCERLDNLYSEVMENEQILKLMEASWENGEEKLRILHHKEAEYKIIVAGLKKEIEDLKVKDTASSKRIGQLNFELRNLEQMLNEIKTHWKNGEEKLKIMRHKEDECNMTVGCLKNEIQVLKVKDKASCRKIDELNSNVRDLKKMLHETEKSWEDGDVKLNITRHKLKQSTVEFELHKKECTLEKEKQQKEIKEESKLREDLLVAVKVANDLRAESEKKLIDATKRIELLEDALVGKILIRNLNLEGQSKRGSLVWQQQFAEVTQEVPVHCSNHGAISYNPAYSGQVAHQRKLAPPGNESSRPDCGIVRKIIEEIEIRAKEDEGTELAMPLKDLQHEVNPSPDGGGVCPPSPEIEPEEKPNPLENLRENHGGSKRNALLKWCQARVAKYSPPIEITNFSTSWSDGRAMFALLHSYVPEKLESFSTKSPGFDPNENFRIVSNVATDLRISHDLDVSELLMNPDWRKILDFITEIYKKFESQDNL